jgi:hypothetical protein
MNIWDSVQRGLEKATHEAGRIARIQRLRATTDNLLRQTTVQQSNLITRAMEVFAAGKLTQSELLPICQELTSLQQQLEQAQAELKIIQSQGATTLQPQTTTVHSPLPPTSASPGDLAATVFAPPPPGYQQPFEATMPAPTPPPPPGTESSALSELATLAMGGSTPTPITGQQPVCSHCGVERIVGNVYCANCGHPFDGLEVAHLPTVRGNAMEGSSLVNQETMREEVPASEVFEQPTIYTPDSPPIEHQETVSGEQSSSPTYQSQPSEQDGGQ